MSNKLYSFFKRIFDIFFSITFIFLLIPIYLLIALKIKNDSEGPILYKPLRTGFNGKTFYIYKFRTMFVGSDLGPGTTSKSDKRITNFGYFLRKFKLDETPQFFNIIKGDMSFVGPRPLLEDYLEYYSFEESKRHNVKPGLTGWAQINGRNQISWDKKFILDIWYVRNQSFSLDILILFKTFWKVLKRDGINNSKNITMPYFKR